jgi:transketolase
MRTAFVRSLLEIARFDERVWLLTADLGYSVLEPFSEEFPKRYVNVGVAEQNMTGIAAGLAHSGKIVFTYSIANFPTLRCLEQIRNDVCYHNLSVKIVSVGGGYSYGPQGYTHHGVEDIGVMRTLPGITVVAPGDPVETAAAVAQLAARPGPAYLRLGKAGEPVVHQSTPAFELSRAIVVRKGADFTVISTGGVLDYCNRRLAEIEQADGLRGTLLSMHTVKPLDRGAVVAAARTSPLIVTVEEHCATNGLGSAVAEVLATLDDRRARYRQLAAADGVACVAGSQEYLRAGAGDLRQIILSALGSARE